MARYRHLPIWKAALELAVHLEQAVRRFPRYHKYTLGSELRQTAQRLCRLVARANDARETRALVLDDLVLTVEEMKTLLTLAKEVGAFAQFVWLPRSSVGASRDAPASRLWAGGESGRDGIEQTSKNMRDAAHGPRSIPDPVDRRGDPVVKKCDAGASELAPTLDCGSQNEVDPRDLPALRAPETRRSGPCAGDPDRP